MKGVHRLTVQSAHLKYEMAFSRNLTVIQGDSATGKTTLVDMIVAYYQNGADTGISLHCDCPVRVLAGNDWKEQLALIHDSLVFIDEGNRFVASQEFAAAIRSTGNYYVIITRESLDNLPYSVTEIYGIRSSGKFQSMEPVYHHLERIYDLHGPEGFSAPVRLITEDSNAGFACFQQLASPSGIPCLAAGGASKIFELLQTAAAADCIVIADGAAFGPQMNRVYQLMVRNSHIHLYLPESFEWLILTSGILNQAGIQEILRHPSDYIDSCSYFSWEQFFIDLLVEKSQGTPYVYTKRQLNPAFVQGKARDKMIRALPASMQALLKQDK